MSNLSETIDFTGRTVAVVGLGKSGRAALRVLVSGLVGRPGRIIASDSGDGGVFESLPESLQRAIADVEFGRHSVEFLTRADCIVLSPGVPVDNKAVAASVAAGVSVMSELELGYRLIGSRVVAITGTNGKTTTTNLVGAIFTAAGIAVEVGGNIGRPLCDIVADGGRPEIVVLEVSSFQLEAISRFHAHGALILNITPDHLNRHGTFECYTETKLRIFNRQEPGDVAVFNADDKTCRDIVEDHEKQAVVPGRGRLLLFSRNEPVAVGAFVREGRIIYKPFADEDAVIDIAGLDDIRLCGDHNLENVLGAVTLCCGMGLTAEPLLKAIRRFRGVVHRLESVDVVSGIEFINDSKATNVASTLCAVKALEKPFVLILGGYDKGSDFSELAREIADRRISTVLMGDTAAKIADALHGAGHRPTAIVPDLERAVEKAWNIADNKYCIVLSPGCASFDQFANFEERGERFKQLVAELKDRINSTIG